MRSRVWISLCLLLLSLEAFSQEDLPMYNANSINPIARYEQLYNIRVWRWIDLAEKQNKGFYAFNAELPKLIMDAVKSGQLANIYDNDSLTTRIDRAEFMKRITAEGQKFEPWDPSKTYYPGDPVSVNGKNYEVTDAAQNGVTGVNPETAGNKEWARSTGTEGSVALPRQLSRLYLTEDVIFDKRRSRLYYDIQAITFYLEKASPDNPDIKLYDPVAAFSYKDLEKLFRDNPAKSIWINRYNSAENKNFADAFLLRLFHATIDRVQNPDNLKITEMFSMEGKSHKEAVMAMEWEEMKMMEREHNLWEY